MARIDQIGIVAGLAVLSVAAFATTVEAQVCDTPSAPVTSASSSAAFQSGFAGGSSFGGSSSGGGSFSSSGVASGSFSRFGSVNTRSSQSRAASGPLTGNESFSTAFGASGYDSQMAQQNAAFYRYPRIQKSADLNVRRANRARSDERLAQRRAMRAANRASRPTPPTSKDVYRSYASNR